MKIWDKLRRCIRNQFCPIPPDSLAFYYLPCKSTHLDDHKSYLLIALASSSVSCLCGRCIGGEIERALQARTSEMPSKQMCCGRPGAGASNSGCARRHFWHAHLKLIITITLSTLTHTMEQSTHINCQWSQVRVSEANLKQQEYTSRKNANRLNLVVNWFKVL